MTANLIDLTQSTFDEAIAAYPLVVLEFWGEKCAPCHLFTAIVEKIAPAYPDILFAKINTDIEVDLTAEFQIRTIPFIMIIREKVAIYADAGLLSEPVLIEMLDKAKQVDLSHIHASSSDNE